MLIHPMMGDVPGVDRDFSIHSYIPGQPIPILVKDPKTGRVVTNELKKYVKPYTLVTENPEIILSGYEQSEPIPMFIDNKGHFEIMRAFFSSSQPEGFTVTLFESRERPLLMNQEVHVATIASGLGTTTPLTGAFPAEGSAGRPFIWPESLFMDVAEQGRLIVAVFRNLSPTVNAIRFNLHGLRWYHTQAPDNIAEKMQAVYRTRFRSMPFFYTTETNVQLLASQERSFDIRFTDEAWIEMHKIMSVSSDPYDIQIVEKASDKSFMPVPIRNTLVAGTGEFPFLLWEPTLFEPNYKLTINLVNADELLGSHNNVYLTLACRKIFWDPKDDRLSRPEEAGGL